MAISESEASGGSPRLDFDNWVKPQFRVTTITLCTRQLTYFEYADCSRLKRAS